MAGIELTSSQYSFADQRKKAAEHFDYHLQILDPDPRTIAQAGKSLALRSCPLTDMLPIG